MSNVHPKHRPEHPDYPFPTEDNMAQDEATVLEQQRKQSGNLPDSSTEAPAKHDKPFKNLTSGR